jgi:RNA polymerase sigma factor (sigma-70 family)
VPDSSTEFFGWSGRVIRHTLIDLSRHYFGAEGLAANHATPARNAGGNETPPREPAGDDRSIDPRQLAEWTKLHEQIELLPPDERILFDLLYYHEMTQQDAAEVLGVDRRTIIRRWQVARQRLMERFHGQPPGSN